MVKKLPTNEIIAQAKSLTYYVEHLVDPLDPECNQIFADWTDITEKYDFYDQRFEENGHVGLRDVEGNIRVPALYRDFDEVFELFDNRNLPVSAINDEGKAALVATDGTGSPLCPFVYDCITLIQHTPYYITEQQGKLGLMSSRGEELLPCTVDEIEYPVNGIFLTRTGNKWGFFCEYGRGFNVPCLYEKMEEYNGYVQGYLNNQAGFFDDKGQFIPENQLSEDQQANLLSLVPNIGMASFP